MHKANGNYRAAYDEYSFRQMYNCIEPITELNANETMVIQASVTKQNSVNLALRILF